MTDERQLEGVRVLITRPRERAGALCFLLEDEGAQVLSLPMLELLPPDDPRPLRSAAEQLHRYAWVAFASPSAVEALVDAARQAGTLEHLLAAKIAVVGPATATAALELGLTVLCEADEKTGRGLFDKLRDRLSTGDEVLLPVAQEGRRDLFEALVAQGVEVTRVAAYQSVAKGLSTQALTDLQSSPPRVILFGSPRSATAFIEATGPSGPTLLASSKWVAIGPTTAAALARLGLEVAAIAEEPTAASLVEATVRAVRG